MNKEFIAAQKEQLLKEKERVESQIQKLKKYPDFGFDEEDNIDEIATYESNITLEEKMSQIKTKIDLALKAIEEGTYGQCAKCKEILEDERLKIMPYADVCVKCQK